MQWTEGSFWVFDLPLTETGTTNNIISYKYHVLNNGAIIRSESTSRQRILVDKSKADTTANQIEKNFEDTWDIPVIEKVRNIPFPNVIYISVYIWIIIQLDVFFFILGGR